VLEADNQAVILKVLKKDYPHAGRYTNRWLKTNKNVDVGQIVNDCLRL